MKLAALLMLLAAVGPLACAGPERRYARFEVAHFADVRLPRSLASFHDDSLYTLRLDHSFATVWDACLDLAAQGAGILVTESVPENAGRLVFAANRPRPYGSALAFKVIGRVPMEPEAVWLAVEVLAQGSATQVTAAWLHPETGAPQSVTVVGRTLERREGEQLGKAATAIQDFLGALEQTVAADRWALKFADLPSAPRHRVGPATPRAEPGDWAEAATGWGNFISARERSMLYLIDHPALRDVLQRIAQLLLRAAAADGLSVAVHVYACERPEPPFAVANGDLFVSSGFLESVRDIDQLAGALAHEIDHVVQGDPMRRMQREVRRFNVTQTAQILLSLASVGVGFMTPVSVTASTADILWEATGQSGLFIGGVTLLWGSSAEYGDQLASSYAIEEEMRADRNGTIYLWRAGFRPAGLREVLQLP